MKRYPGILLYLLIICLSRDAESAQPTNNQAQVIKLHPDILKAQQLESQKRYEEAQKIYENLYESQKDDLSFWKLILMYEETHNYKAMERLTLDRLTYRTGDISSMRYLARAYYGQQDMENGRRTLMRIIGNNWKVTSRVSIVGNEFRNQNELDKALEVYLAAREHTGNTLLFARETANIYTIRKEHIKALEEYIKTIDLTKTNITVIKQMIQTAIEEGIKQEDIVRTFDKYLNQNPKSINAARILSRLKYGEKDYETAYRVLVNSAVAANSPQDVWSLAECFKKDGLINEALLAYEDYYRHFNEDPKRVNALLESASLKFELGDRKGAMQDYQRINRDYHGSPEAATASLMMIQISRDSMSFEGFTGSLSEFASTVPFGPVAHEAYMTLGKTFLHSGKVKDAKDAFGKARIKSRSKEEQYDVSVHEALLAFFTGDLEAMSNEIDACMRNYPDGESTKDILELKVLGMRCSSGSEIKGFNTYARGHYALYREDFGAAADSFMTAAQDTSSVVASYAARSLAELLTRQGDTLKAAEWYLYAATAAHDTTVHVGALMDAADIYAQKLNDMDRAGSLYYNALVSNPDNVYESELRRKLSEVVKK
ncbi:tetratricopeptide repeat protein [Candidatus Latescibacterota bacterium]